jgi:hypothetical protein
MEKNVWYLTTIVLLSVFVMGCTSLSEPVINTPATVTETPLVIFTQVIPDPTPGRTVATPTITPTETPAPVSSFKGYQLFEKEPEPGIIEPSETPAVEYRTYTDSDFTIRYPSTWVVSNYTVTPPYNRMCGENKLRGEARGVRIVNPDNNSVNFTALTSDFIVKGNCNIRTTIDVWQATVQPTFPDTTGASALTNFNIRYTELRTPIVGFDVVTPEWSAWYPNAYTERDIISYSHLYTFRFNTRNPTEYKNLKDTMFGSLVTEERVMVVA